MGDLHAYLNEHSGEAPSAEEFKQLLETHGCLSGDTAAIWQLVLDSFTRCSAITDFTYELKSIRDMIPCLKKDDKAINDAI
jgi:hypothetical protein